MSTDWSTPIPPRARSEGWIVPCRSARRPPRSGARDPTFAPPSRAPVGVGPGKLVVLLDGHRHILRNAIARKGSVPRGSPTDSPAPPTRLRGGPCPWRAPGSPWNPVRAQVLQREQARQIVEQSTQVGRGAIGRGGHPFRIGGGGQTVTPDRLEVDAQLPLHVLLGEDGPLGGDLGDIGETQYAHGLVELRRGPSPQERRGVGRVEQPGGHDRVSPDHPFEVRKARIGESGEAEELGHDLGKGAHASDRQDHLGSRRGRLRGSPMTWPGFGRRARSWIGWSFGPGGSRLLHGTGGCTAISPGSRRSPEFRIPNQVRRPGEARFDACREFLDGELGLEHHVLDPELQGRLHRQLPHSRGHDDHGKLPEDVPTAEVPQQLDPVHSRHRPCPARRWTVSAGTPFPGPGERWRRPSPRSRTPETVADGSPRIPGRCPRRGLGGCSTCGTPSPWGKDPRCGKDRIAGSGARRGPWSRPDRWRPRSCPRAGRRSGGRWCNPGRFPSRRIPDEWRRKTGASVRPVSRGGLPGFPARRR